MTSVNEQLMAPECTIGSWGFEMKWYIMQALPLVFIFGFVVMAAIKLLLDVIRRRYGHLRLLCCSVSMEKYAISSVCRGMFPVVERITPYDLAVIVPLVLQSVQQVRGPLRQLLRHLHPRSLLPLP